MRIAIIDADLIGRKRHRFPNLSCMKISGYYKRKGETVTLKTDYEDLAKFDKVYIAKVFTDTPILEDVLKMQNVEYGGTGFYYDRAKALPYEIEHTKPDYQLYNEWLKEVDKGGKEYKAYKEYSIGFLTRGCFRHCGFCVNRNAEKVVVHSPIEEFLDKFRKKIALLDDNFFGYSESERLLKKLIDTGKAFTFKQGLDVRLLDEAKSELLFSAKYDGDYIFAFDNVSESRIVEEKLRLIRRYTKKRIKFYCLCGYSRSGKYDKEFWENDLVDLFRRIEILMEYDALPFVMKHENYKKSPYRKIYTDVARWCNQVRFYWKMSFGEYSEADSGKIPQLDFLADKYLRMKRR